MNHEPRLDVPPSRPSPVHAMELRTLLLENLMLGRELALAQERVTRALAEKDARIRALQAQLSQTRGEASRGA
ncbi:hypothetical protein [Thiomonas sp. FB-6]|uniref:hypothetical protein n=1 Tax=Thiomonas sp. FB-6 TaxID=1158291 RepID=UPI00037497AC|nr:hypothetical protein [Thiomonas sp. FB-6]